jgi:hypothetical protein
VVHHPHALSDPIHHHVVICLKKGGEKDPSQEKVKAGNEEGDEEGFSKDNIEIGFFFNHGEIITFAVGKVRKLLFSYPAIYARLTNDEIYRFPPSLASCVPFSIPARPGFTQGSGRDLAGDIGCRIGEIQGGAGN